MHISACIFIFYFYFLLCLFLIVCRGGACFQENSLFIYFFCFFGFVCVLLIYRQGDLERTLGGTHCAEDENVEMKDVHQTGSKVLRAED